jgi:N-acetylneuraminic acid mutarotase
MHRHVVTLVFSFVFLNVSYSQLPTPRSSGHLFYFKPTKSLLLIDGYNSGTQPVSGKSELWQWKDQSWKKIDSNDQPMRSLSAAAYIDDNNEIFIYGGTGDNGYADSLRDTYIYNGNRWKTIEDRSIGTHDHHEMVYDKVNKMIVVYGGQTGSRQFDTKTWIFKDNKWKALDIPSPGPRVHHAMAYDSERKKTVLFGGFGDKKDYDDTWEFDGKNWTQIPTTISPGARGHLSMVYDPISKRVLLYGGDAGMTAKGDVWAWDGKKWEQLSDNGPQRILPAIEFDPDKNKLYVFGGSGGEGFQYIYSDLWEWDGKKWTKLSDGEVYKFDMQKNKFIKIEK